MKLLIWTSLLFANLAFAQTNEKFPTDSLTKELTELSSKNSIIGFSVAIVNQDGILYAKGFGYVDKDKNKHYTKNTLQPIASISKTLVGVALMKAQELGKLNLDDDINKYLPFRIVNPYFPNNKITIRNLATHSSGLKDSRNYPKTMIYKDFYSLPKKTRKHLSKNECRKCGESKNIPMIDFIENIYSQQGDWYKKKHFLKEPTGTKYHYANNNAAIAAYIIEQVTGEKYVDFIKKHITEPLNMTSSNWIFEDPKTKDVSIGYAAGIPMPKMNLITYPDGGFVTNVIDFGNYFSTIINGYSGVSNILNSDSYAEMLSQQIQTEFGSGLFWEVGSKWIGHPGGDPGTSTYAYFNKENLKGFILFGNTTDIKDLGNDETEIIRVLQKYLRE